MVLQVQGDKNMGIAVNLDIFTLACSPDHRVSKYSSCIVGGVRYSTVERDANKKTHNSGIMLPAAKNFVNTDEIDYYGVLMEIICLQYHNDRSVVLFKGDWFKPGEGRYKYDGYFRSINVGKVYKNRDDYILATQVQKVFYLADRGAPAGKQQDWKIVQTYDHRHLYNVSENEGARFGDDAYQENGLCGQEPCTSNVRQEPGTSEVPSQRNVEPPTCFDAH